jgi:hypothetical protein
MDDEDALLYEGAKEEEGGEKSANSDSVGIKREADGSDAPGEQMPARKRTKDDDNSSEKELQRWRAAFSDHMSSIPSPKDALDLLLEAQAGEREARARADSAEKRVRALQAALRSREAEAGELRAGLNCMRACGWNERRIRADPPVAREASRLRSDADEANRRAQESREELESLKASEESKDGRMLASRIRALREENHELSAEAREGRAHQLRVELAMASVHGESLRSHLDELNAACSHHSSAPQSQQHHHHQKEQQHHQQE